MVGPGGEVIRLRPSLLGLDHSSAGTRFSPEILLAGLKPSPPRLPLQIMLEVGPGAGYVIPRALVRTSAQQYTRTWQPPCLALSNYKVRG